MSGLFRFGDFELDVDAYVLRRGGRSVKVERIPMELLMLLVRKGGSLATREEVRTALWRSDVFLEQDAAMNTAVRKVRQALGDDAANPRFVETVIAKGYRFIAPVERYEGDVTTGTCCVMRGEQEFLLKGGDNLLGRDRDARVYIDHPSVSRRHARISLRPDRAILEDLRSRNGTYLNGRSVDSPTEVGDGATIGLGRITLTFLVRSEPGSTVPMDKSDNRRGRTAP